ncbi:MAG: hypothetical protein GPOALKHO_000095 [Sodalis sp.]|nr:MAG: hypothetical protein GPOALKHO_000095 [Sodalis sp.]
MLGNSSDIDLYIGEMCDLNPKITIRTTHSANIPYVPMGILFWPAIKAWTIYSNIICSDQGEVSDRNRRVSEILFVGASRDGVTPATWRR